MAVLLAADLRPSADGSAVRTWLRCRQPACIQPSATARLGLGQTDRRIAVSLNAPPPPSQRREHNKSAVALPGFRARKGTNRGVVVRERRSSIYLGAGTALRQISLSTGATLTLKRSGKSRRTR